jgi:hypothetical protein
VGKPWEVSRPQTQPPGDIATVEKRLWLAGLSWRRIETAVKKCPPTLWAAGIFLRQLIQEAALRRRVSHAAPTPPRIKASVPGSGTLVN